MINSLISEFKNIIWPKKKKVIEDFGIVLVIGIFLMIVVLCIDNATQLGLEKIMTFFL